MRLDVSLGGLFLRHLQQAISLRSDHTVIRPKEGVWRSNLSVRGLWVRVSGIADPHFLSKPRSLVVKPLLVTWLVD